MGLIENIPNLKKIVNNVLEKGDDKAKEFGKDLARILIKHRLLEPEMGEKLS